MFNWRSWLLVTFGSLLAVAGLFVTAAPTPTSFAAPDIATLYRRVNVGDDDAEERIPSGSTNVHSSDLELVYDSDLPADQLVGMRFLNLSIPPGAIVTNAYIEFAADESSSGATSLLFRAQAADNPPAFVATNNNISSRPLTAASVSWNNLPAWTRYQLYQSPNLASIIQEIINRPAWTSGNPFSRGRDGFRQACRYCL
ncbi:MAG: hypothetical protein IPL28_11510 [Chloroflexi bacterium]|nr:hypothetical protein [Chloroflexota bacterium]